MTRPLIIQDPTYVEGSSLSMVVPSHGAQASGHYSLFPVGAVSSLPSLDTCLSSGMTSKKRLATTTTTPPRVKILIRHTHSLRSLVLGTIISCDRHWNVLLKEDWVEIIPSTSSDGNATIAATHGAGATDRDVYRSVKACDFSIFNIPPAKAKNAKIMVTKSPENQGGCIFIRGSNVVYITSTREQ